MYIIVLLLIGTSLVLIDTTVSAVDVVSLPCYFSMFCYSTQVLQYYWVVTSFMYIIVLLLIGTKVYIVVVVSLSCYFPRFSRPLVIAILLQLHSIAALISRTLPMIHLLTL